MIEGRGHAIAGEVYEVDAKTLARLDVLEGHPRDYRSNAITLADGSSAETYLLTPAQIDGRPLIASGNWRGRRREKVG